MLNLCLNNSLLCSFLLPIVTYSHLNSEALPTIFPDWFCRILGYLLYVYQGQSYFGLFLITLNRYFVMVRPKNKYLGFGGRKKTLAILATSWILTLVILLIPVIDLLGEYGYVRILGFCTLKRFDVQLNYHFIRFLAFISFLNPLILMVIAYIWILVVVITQKKKVHTTGQTTMNSRKWRRETSLTLTSFSLVAVFIIGFLPISLCTFFPKLNFIPAYQATASVLGYLHTIVNPLLYVLGDPKIRRIVMTRILARENVPELNSSHGVGEMQNIHI